MAYRVELEFRRAARRLIPEDRGVLAAVSGGADSVTLLHLLSRLMKTRAMPLTVAHLDHGMRRGSAADRLFVARLAESLSLPCVSDRRVVAELRRRDESLEEAARRIRRAFLLHSSRESGMATIALGHTLDDQAETILMRLVRGAGATALTGMLETGPGPFVRPLLGLERAECRDYAKKKGFEFREDPSNRDVRFDRNRVRLEVLPVLCEALNVRAGRHLVQAANRLREDAMYLDELADRRLSQLVSRGPAGRLSLPPSELCALPPAIRKRVVRRVLQEAGVDARRIATRHVEAVLDLAEGGSGRRVDLPGRRRARRERSRLVLEPVGRDRA